MYKQVAANGPTEDRQAPRFSIEIFPPRQANGRFVKTLKNFCLLQPEFISVTCGAFGKGRFDSTKKIALEVRALGGTPAVHFTCLGKTDQQLRREAEEYKENGLTRIVALRGDYRGDPAHAPDKRACRHAVSLVEILSRMGGFDISVAAYPEKHPQADSMQQDLEYLKQKLDAGANRAITQFFLDPEIFLRFRDQAAAAGIDKPIIPGILPILNISRVADFSSTCNVSVPAFIHQMFQGTDHRSLDHRLLAMNILSHQITRLISEEVNFFHFYSLNETVLNTHICRWLKTAF